MMVLVSACAMAPKPFTEAEMKAQAVADQKTMFAASDPITKPLSLADAMARALKYNLDSRSKMMERALALGQTDLDRWDLLPKVTASAGYIGRSDHATTTSRDSKTLQPALSNPYYSTDRDRLTADLGVSWNILDFGLGYFNARENADRVLIAEEQRRKTIHNVLQQVRYAFWRAAAAQVLEPAVTKALADGEQALADARKVEAAGLKNPAETLHFEKTLLGSLRQLEAMSQDMSTAKVELAALINVPPGTQFTLDVPADATMTPPVFSMPLEQMEEVAFVNNPDLREQGYQSRIAVDETRKTIVRAMPGLNLSASRQWDSNSFLIDNQWYEAGARMSMNLINLLSLPDQLDQAEAREKVAEARRMALRMAVLAQVHISYRQFVNSGKLFERADELYKVENRLSELSTARTQNDAQGVLEQINNQTEAINASMNRYQSYALMQQALGRIYATLGQDLLPAGMASGSVDAVSAVVERSLTAWSQGEVPNLPAPAPAPSQAPQPAAVAVTAPAPSSSPSAATKAGASELLEKAWSWVVKGFDKPAAAAEPAAKPAPQPGAEQISQRVNSLFAQSGASSVPPAAQ